MDTAGRRGLQHLCLQLLALQAITSLCVASCTASSSSAHILNLPMERFGGYTHDCFAHKSGPAGKHEHCIADAAVFSTAAATCLGNVPDDEGTSRRMQSAFVICVLSV